MNFDLIAKDLLSQKPLSKGTNPVARANALVELNDAGFGRKEIFSELRQLYDDAEDDIIKKQILDIVIKVHGLYKDDDKKETPNITFNIVGKVNRVADMLCPPPAGLGASVA